MARLALPHALLFCCFVPVLPAAAQGLQRCEGTLLEVPGNAEVRRPAGLLAVSMRLMAEGKSADASLALLQERLAAVRSALQALAVKELRVSSPSTWMPPAERGRPRKTRAQLQISGILEPDRLQPLIRQVGALPGVQLSPVTPTADPTQDGAVRRQLLEAAYRDAFEQARTLGVAVGQSRLAPVEVKIQGGNLRPQPMRAMADAAIPEFDPAELPEPTQTLSLLARFCAR